MAGAVLRREYVKAHLHQIVAAILLAVALQLRLLARHQIGLLYGVCLAGVQTLQLHVVLRLLIARMHVVGKEHCTLLVLADIIDGAMASLVDELNALLMPEAQIELPSPNSLTTEVRIYALMRLGVTDSQEIATLLFYSTQTIYNYKSAMRTRAINRDTFDEDISRLCHIG